MDALAAQRADVQSRLDRAKATRGACLLDGKPYDDGEIVALENQMAALSEAEGEQVRRQRAAAADEWAQLRQGLLAELRSQDLTRLKATADAERASRDLVDAINRVLTAAEAERNAISRLGVTSFPLGLTESETARRLSANIASCLAGIKGHRSRFQNIQWHHPGGPVSARDWAEKERAATDISSIIERN